mgnify:CR=1 FL=1
MLRVLIRLLLAGLLGAVLAAAAGAWWWQRPLPLRPLAGQTVVDVTVPAGASARGVAEALVAAGVDTPAWLLHLGFRASGESRRIKAGSYELEAGATPQSVLDKLVRGDQALRQLGQIRSELEYRPIAEILDDLQRHMDAVQLATSATSEAVRHRYFPTNAAPSWVAEKL